jgi:hypothetical protein
MTLSPPSARRLKRVIDIVSVLLLGLLLIVCPIWMLAHQQTLRGNVPYDLFMKLAITAIAVCTFSGIWLILRHQDFKGRIDMRDRRIRLVLILAPLIPVLAYITMSLNN